MNGDEKQVLDRYQKWMNQGVLEVHDGSENDFPWSQVILLTMPKRFH